MNQEEEGPGMDLLIRAHEAVLIDVRRSLDLDRGLADALIHQHHRRIHELVIEELNLEGGLALILGAHDPATTETSETTEVQEPAVSESATESLREPAQESEPPPGVPSGSQRARRSAERDLRGGSYVDRDLDGFDFSEADLSRANFEAASLVDAKFYGCRLNHVNFRKANLLRADMRNADLEGADLHQANINAIDIRGANMVNAHFDLTDLDGVRWDSSTEWSPNDLSRIRGMSRQTAAGDYVAEVPPEALAAGARARR